MRLRPRWPVRLLGVLVFALVGAAPFQVSPSLRKDLPSFALDPEVEQISRYLEWRAPGSLEPSLRRQVAIAITEEARINAIDPLLILAVISVESGFVPDAVSNAQAKGLLQLRDVTIREIVKHVELPAKSALEPEEVVELRLGIRYLSLMLRRFPDPARALAAWNAGPGAVKRELAATGEVPKRWLAFSERVFHAKRRLEIRFEKGLPPPLETMASARPPAAIGI